MLVTCFLVVLNLVDGMVNVYGKPSLQLGRFVVPVLDLTGSLGTPFGDSHMEAINAGNLFFSCFEVPKDEIWLVDSVVGSSRDSAKVVFDSVRITGGTIGGFYYYVGSNDAGIARFKWDLRGYPLTAGHQFLFVCHWVADANVDVFVLGRKLLL